MRVVADLLPKEANINVEAGDEVGDRVVPRAALALDGDAFPAGANFPQYRVGWRTPGGATEKDLRRRTYRGPGHIDFDTLAEMVLSTISEQPQPSPSDGAA